MQFTVLQKVKKIMCSQINRTMFEIYRNIIEDVVTEGQNSSLTID